MRTRSDRIQRTAAARSGTTSPLAWFLVLAFAITWVVWIPRALSHQGVLDSPVAERLGSVWTYGPALAAVIAAALTGGRPAVSLLGRRLLRWRVGWRWWTFALTWPMALWLAADLLHRLFTGNGIRPAAVEVGLAGAVPLFVVLCLSDGLGEETGWRGFALPALLERTGAASASVLLGVVWAVWHLPLYWTTGVPLERAPVLLLLVDLPVTAVVYTWVFQHTGGSALLAVVLHGASNLFGVPMLSADGSVRAYLLALAVKVVFVVALLVTTDPRTLRRSR